MTPNDATLDGRIGAYRLVQWQKQALGDRDKCLGPTKESQNMYPPKNPSELAINTHAYQQGKARYGLELTYGNLYEMVQAIEAGIGVLLYRRRSDSGEWGAAYAIPFAGLLLPIAVIEHATNGLIVATILPVQVYMRELTPRIQKKLDKLQARIDAVMQEMQERERT